MRKTGNAFVQLFRIVQLVILFQLFSRADAAIEIFEIGSLGLILSFIPERSFAGLWKHGPAFAVACLCSWWPVRQGMEMMEGGGWIVMSGWGAFVLFFASRETAEENYFPDRCAVLCFSMLAAPEQAISLGQGMSFGWQAGTLSMLLSERIATRLSEGWERPAKASPSVRFAGLGAPGTPPSLDDRRMRLPLLAGVFFLAHLFYIQNYGYSGQYSWIHNHFFTTAILIFLFLWTTPLLKNPNGNQFGLAISTSSAVLILAAVGSRLSHGETLGATRLGFALLHPNLIGSASLLSIIILFKKDQPLNPALVLVGGILFSGLVLSLSRWCLFLFILWSFNRVFDLSKIRISRVLGGIVLVVLLYQALLVAGFIPMRFDWRRIPSERRWIYKAAVSRIFSNPMGDGFLQFGYGPQPIPGESQQVLWDWFYPHCHQVFLEIFLSMGIFYGTFSVLLIIFSFSRQPKDSSSRELLVFQGILGFSDFYWFTPFHLAIFFWSFVGPSGDIYPSKDRPIIGSKMHPPILLLGLIPLLLTSLSETNSDLSSHFSRKSWIILSQGDSPKAENFLNQAIKLDPNRIENYLYRIIMKSQAGKSSGIDSDIEKVSQLARRWDTAKVCRALFRFPEKTGFCSIDSFSLLQPDIPDLSGWRNFLFLLLCPGKNQLTHAGNGIARSFEIGEILLGLPSPFGPEFVKQTLKECLLSSASTDLGVTAIDFLVSHLPGEGNRFPWPNISTFSKSNLESSLIASALRYSVIQKDKGLFEDLRNYPAAKNGSPMFKVNAFLSSSAGDFTQALDWIKKDREVFDPGNEGITDLRSDLLEALCFARMGDKNRALSLARKVLDQAPHWMEARQVVAQFALENGLRDEARSCIADTIQIIQGSWKIPTLFSHYEFERKPVGDNWTIIMGKTFLRIFMKKNWPDHVPFKQEKLLLLKDLQAKLKEIDESQK